MHGMLIAVIDKEQAACNTHTARRTRQKSKKLAAEGDGINFEGEPHDLGIRSRDSRELAHCLLSPGSALAHTCRSTWRTPGANPDFVGRWRRDRPGLRYRTEGPT